MDRRDVLKAAGATTATATLAGCSSIPLLGPCGPGESEIGQIAQQAGSSGDGGGGGGGTTDSDDSLSSIKGSIQSMSEDSVVIDDGTGTAQLTTLTGGGFVSQNVGEGDCVVAEGVGIEPQDGTDADVTFIVTDVSLADDG
jgi:hypothetical protein